MAAADCAIPGGDALEQRLGSLGQDHVLDHAARLDAAARARLRAQLAALDWDALAAGRAVVLALASGAGPATSLARSEVEPPPVVRLPEHGGDAAAEAQAREAGESLLAEGRVAALLLAGGQGTRLGFDGPKGAYPIGPVSGRSLFALHAERLRAVRRRHGRWLRWLVMTSRATHAETEALFARQDGFGVPRDAIHFFEQGVAPALDARGRLLLEAPGRLALCPDGHGGAIPALVDAGLLDALEDAGVRWLSTYQVDNPLASPVEPVALGHLALRGAEMSAKVVARRRPEERVGTPLVVRGSLRIVEYSEIDPELVSARTDDGALRFWAGSIGMHGVGLGLVRRIAGDREAWLPHHASAKRIPVLAPDGSTREPAEPNGYKLERFVFDALAAAREAVLVEVRREDSYAPVKNESGGESPATAREALDALARRWIAAAGLAPPDAPLELDHARVADASEARALGPALLEPPILRTSSGGDAA